MADFPHPVVVVQGEGEKAEYSSDEEDTAAVHITVEDEANNYIAFLGNLIIIIDIQYSI